MMTDEQIEARQKSLTQAERLSLYKELCGIIGGGNTEIPMRFLCDLPTFMVFKELHVNPVMLDKYFAKIKGTPVPDGTSTKDFMLEKYGERAVELVMLLI